MQAHTALCETGVTRLLRGALSDCRAVQRQRYNFIFNATATFIFVCIIGAFLYYNYKGRVPPEVAEAKRQADYQNILGKLNKIQSEREKGKGLITELPLWDTRIAAPQLH